MIVLTSVAALIASVLVLALVTQVGVALVERAHPAPGQIIAVDGARLHVVDLGPREASGPAVVMLHGASSNVEVMRPLAERLARTRRVILVDRPGHGWSTRERFSDSTPQPQARMIAEVLQQLGIGSAVLIAHSWSGALALRIALDHPERVAGLVMLAPVAYPWPGGVSQYNYVVTTPVVGPLLAYTVTLPLGLMLAEPGTRGVFAPQAMAESFVKDSATRLLLRPREFIANAWDLVSLRQAMAEQAPRYATLSVPISIIAGDADKTVSTHIHSQPLARTAKNARLTVLPGVGHMIQYSAPDLVISEVEAMTGHGSPSTTAVAN